jgi:hypothetical protein
MTSVNTACNQFLNDSHKHKSDTKYKEAGILTMSESTMRDLQGRNDGLPGYSSSTQQEVSQDHNPLVQLGAYLTPRDLPFSQTFDGNVNQNAEDFLSSFQIYVSYKRFCNDEPTVISSFCLLLRDKALQWFHSLPDHTKRSWHDLKTAFLERFSPLRRKTWQSKASLWSMKQKPNQNVSEYISEVQRMAGLINVDNATAFDVMFNGVLPKIRSFLLQKEVDNIEDLIKYSRQAEDLNIPDQNANSEILETMKQIQLKLDSVNVRPVSPVPRSSSQKRHVSFDSSNRRSTSPAHQHSESASSQDYPCRESRPRPIRYNTNSFNNQPQLNQQYNAPRQTNNFRQTYYTPNMQPSYSYQRTNTYQPRYTAAPRQYYNNAPRQYNASAMQNYNATQSYGGATLNVCGNCGSYHQRGRCKAFGVQCNGCLRYNHFESMCRSSGRQATQPSQQA